MTYHGMASKKKDELVDEAEKIKAELGEPNKKDSENILKKQNHKTNKISKKTRF